MPVLVVVVVVLRINWDKSAWPRAVTIDVPLLRVYQ
jgi:hypothetical protein